MESLTEGEKVNLFVKRWLELAQKILHLLNNTKKGLLLKVQNASVFGH